MIKNLTITVMSLALLVFVLYHIGLFENTSWAKRDDRNQHEVKRIKMVRAEKSLTIGSVYSSKDLPASESVKGATIAAELLQAEGKKIKYITVSDCHRYPETATEIQKLCSDYKVAAILGPGNTEMLVSLRAITQFHALPLISPVTVRPDKLPVLENDNYISFFPPLGKWVDEILAHMKNNKIKRILIICPENGTYGEMFSSVLERKGKDFLDDSKIYRMSYQQPLNASHFSNTMANYGGQHQVDAIFFGGVESDLPELLDLLKTQNMTLPVYVSDDITLKDVPKDAQGRLFLPEADVPVSNPEWQKFYVSRYKTQPSYQAVLGAETMFALVNKAEKATYTPDTFVQAMDQAAKELNQRIKIKIVEFSSGKP